MTESPKKRPEGHGADPAAESVPGWREALTGTHLPTLLVPGQTPGTKQEQQPRTTDRQTDGHQAQR